MKANRRDHNQATIQKVFEAHGCLVFDTSRVGGGFPDLNVLDRERSIRWVEVKNKASGYGKAGLNKNQTNLARKGWPIYVVSDAEDVLSLLAIWEGE